MDTMHSLTNAGYNIDTMCHVISSGMISHERWLSSFDILILSKLSSGMSTWDYE